METRICGARPAPDCKLRVSISKNWIRKVGPETLEGQFTSRIREGVEDLLVGPIYDPFNQQRKTVLRLQRVVLPLSLVEGLLQWQINTWKVGNFRDTSS